VAGTVYAEITLKNAGDRIKVRDGFLPEGKVRQATVKALVDTGAGTLVIDENTCQKLGLEIRGLRSATVANGAREVCKVTEPVEIHWKNRETACPAIVLPGTDGVLLGAIPLEDMDLVVNPAKQELSGAHGDEVMCLIV
jgi:clan AA aspartic protease